MKTNVYSACITGTPSYALLTTIEDVASLITAAETQVLYETLKSNKAILIIGISYYPLVEYSILGFKPYIEMILNGEKITS